MASGLAPRWASLRADFRRRLGLAQAEGRDVDLEQAFLRVTIGAGILVYCLMVVAVEPEFTLGLQLALIAASSATFVGASMVWWYRRTPKRPPQMRFLAICSDIIPLTVGLWGAGEPGVPLVGVYLWVTVGNGFRYGPTYLLFAYWLSGLCFTLLLFFVPFWQAHRGIGVGFGLVLATIPLYVLVLLSRLTAQKDAALELSNAKSRFVANVSHELRTPLTGVFAVYDLLLRRRLPQEDRELIGSLGSAIATLKSSVDAVLQMSKLEAGAEHAEQRLLNLRFLMHQLSALVSPQASARKLSWLVDIDVSTPTTVVGDSRHIQHVLGNLINNAIKFTPRGGVTMRVAAVKGGVRFEVIDTGIGIRLDKQETLFERFVQADQSATRKYGGTGLGTSIAHDLVKLMGGDIGVTSAPGQGSTFWVELPLLAPGPEFRISGDQSERTEVLVIGASQEHWETLSSKLTSIGVTPRRCEPIPSSLDSLNLPQCLAGVLVMPPADAAHFSETMLGEFSGAVCPWIVVASSVTSAQEASLLRTGITAVMPPVAPAEDWRRELLAFNNRVELTVPHATNDNINIGTSRSLTIVLADDNRSNRMLIGRILGDAGHIVKYAERGDEAFDLMLEQRPDLAILDLNMPEMSGPDVTKLYRAGEIGSRQRLPIIILSADATPASRNESLDAGANDYLVKPVTAADLLAAIERNAAVVRSGPDASREGAVTVTGVKSTTREPTTPSTALPLRAALATGLVVNKAMLLDAERIEALRRIGNHDRKFMKQYAEAVFDDLELAISDLRRAIAVGNPRDSQDALHKLDGTCASIGAVAMAACAKSMRNYVTSGPDADANAALAELSTTCALTKSALAAVIHEVSTSRPSH